MKKWIRATALALGSATLGWLIGAHSPPVLTTPERGFKDPRFSLVEYREGELLEIPLFAEVYRIARIRLHKESLPPKQFYDELFSSCGTGPVVIQHTGQADTNFTVLLGKTETSGRCWEFPVIQHEINGSQYLAYRSSVIRMTFEEIGNRYILTHFWDMLTVSLAKESLDATVLTYYRRHDSMIGVESQNIQKRLAHAQQILEEVRQKSLVIAPEASGLRRPVDLSWTETDSGCAAWVQSQGMNGRTPVTISIEALLDYSDNHLRQLFSHELGHVVRDEFDVKGYCDSSDKDAPCQLAAEAFALKFMGETDYRRNKVFNEGMSESETDTLIRRLTTINLEFPES